MPSEPILRPQASYTLGLRDLSNMPHVSIELGGVLRDCADLIDLLDKPTPPASADALGEVGVIWCEGRDAVLDFRHQFCGSPSRATVLGDLENYTEYAEECEALARKVAALSAMPPAGEVERLRETLLEVRGKNAANFDRNGAAWEAYDRAVLDCIAAIREPKP